MSWPWFRCEETVAVSLEQYSMNGRDGASQWAGQMLRRDGIGKRAQQQHAKVAQQQQRDDFPPDRREGLPCCFWRSIWLLFARHPTIVIRLAPCDKQKPPQRSSDRWGGGKVPAVTLVRRPMLATAFESKGSEAAILQQPACPFGHESRIPWIANRQHEASATCEPQVLFRRG